jgi:hypothetical protein
MRATSRLIKWTFGIAATLAVAAAGSAACAQPMPMDRDPPPKSETDGQAPPAAENPSQQLDRQKGVIQPPQSVDPEMQVRPPNPGEQKTPVIPPPGSPGGDPTIQPK